MGLGTVLSTEATALEGENVTEVKVDPGGGPNFTADNFAPSGDDSPPLPNDTVATIPTTGSGEEGAVGYNNPIAEQKSSPGEKRIYARDASGNEIAEIWIKSDGEITLVGPNSSITQNAAGEITGTNGAGSFKLDTLGAFVANGATIDITGDVVSATGVSLSFHTHLFPASGGAPTSPPIPTP